MIYLTVRASAQVTYRLGHGHLRNSLARLSVAVDDGGICHPGIYTVITRAGSLIGRHTVPRLEGLAVGQGQLIFGIAVLVTGNLLTIGLDGCQHVHLDCPIINY